MSRTLSLSSIAPRISRTRFTHAGIPALAVIASIVVLSAASMPANAQVPARPATRWEFLMSSGAILPAGEQRNAISSGALSTLQLSYAAHPAIAVTTTVGWARSRDLATADDATLDLFTYDVGAEVRAPNRNIGKSVTFRPFAGVGGGARSYNHRHLDLTVTHNAAAYGGLGGELGFGGVQVRIEARNYVTDFQPLAGRGSSNARSEVALLAGLRFMSR